MNARDLAQATTFVLACTVLAGCTGDALRRPIPMAYRDLVEIDGIPNAHCTFTSQSAPRLREELVSAFRQDLEEGGHDQERTYHALCLSGGGDGGAFGAGFLNGWTQVGGRPDFKIVTGVSTGALLAPLAFLGSDYDARLETLFTTINSEDILNPRWLLQILRADSMATSEPLRNLISETVTPQLLRLVAEQHRAGRRLYVATTNLDAQRLAVWDLGAIASSDSPNAREVFIDAMLASASIPGVLPPVYVEVKAPDGKTYTEMHVDGATRTNTFFPDLFFDVEGSLSDGVMSSVLRDAGLDYEKVLWRIYYVRNGELDHEYQATRPRLRPIAGRAIATLMQSVNFADLLRFSVRGSQPRTKVFLAGLPDDYHRPDVDEFDNAEMRRMFEIGVALAQDPSAWRSLDIQSLLSGKVLDLTQHRAD